MPIGLFGGTFDPVHNAHLAMARAALDQLALERVVFLPTGAPRYRAPAIASAAQRVAMLRLAIEGEPRFAIDERELAPGHSGYTVDTVASLGYRPVLLLGADQYAKFETWHRWRDLLALAELAVFARPGWREGRAPARHLPFAAMEVSASDVRARLARAESIAGLVPGEVERYLRREGLYR
ncbi:MAG: nicotinate (nicotinamide) nucleotide adenylyltransferase [Burkholderiales bacterium]